MVGGPLEPADFLIRRGAEVARYSAQLLGLAARAARKDLVELLLANGADPRAVGVGIYVDVADLDLLRYLLDRGADLTRLDTEGKTALDRAREAGKTSAVTFLDSPNAGE